MYLPGAVLLLFCRVRPSPAIAGEAKRNSAAAAPAALEEMPLSRSEEAGVGREGSRAKGGERGWGGFVSWCARLLVRDPLGECTIKDSSFELGLSVQGLQVQGSEFRVENLEWTVEG